MSLFRHSFANLRKGTPWTTHSGLTALFAIFILFPLFVKKYLLRNNTEELVKHLAKRKPLRAVFRDSSYGSDSVKINVEQIFKLLSPGTEVRTI